MQEDLLVQIENKMSTFSKSQKLIANYIINSYEKAAYMTALKLGNAVNVSESTVVRFAIEMGFEGYSQDASSSDCRYTPDFSRAAGGREHSDIENGRIS